MTAQARRGQPLIALALVLTSWVGFRAAVWDWPVAAQPPEARAPQPDAVPTTAKDTALPIRSAATATGSATTAIWPQLAADAPQNSILAEPRLASSVAVAAASRSGPTDHQRYARIAAGHELLWPAQVSGLVLPADVAQHFSARPPLAVPPVLPRSAAAGERRWSGDSWLLLRRGGYGFNLSGAGLPGANLPSGTYGASQAGAVLRYRLAPTSPHRPAAYFRVSSGLERPRGEEAALGLSLRPLSKVPVAALAEGRVIRTLSGILVRPALALVSEFPPQPLPLGIRGEAYAQAGWVGGKYSTAFADGQARLEKPLLSTGRLELRAGAGVWGGAQRGAKRLDVGPTATLAVPLGEAGGRLSADWRFRIAGEAAPGSGPALTLSAGF